MRVIVDMPDELVAELDALAKEHERSRAWAIRAACREYVIALPIPAADAMREARATIQQETDRHAFEPQPGNALRCASCGGEKAQHG